MTTKTILIKDPSKTEERFRNNKTEFDNNIIETFIYQSSQGINVSRIKKGKRSYARLNALRTRLKAWETWIKKYCHKKIIEITDEELLGLYNKLEEGKITRKNGEKYKSVGDYSTDFKTFWHWYQKYMRKTHKIEIEDITIDMAINKDSEPEFHYFDFNGFKKMIENARYEYKVLMWFLYDTGIRAPKELSNIKVSDITEDINSDKLNVDIRDEISKTFGRKIRLMLCSELIREFIKRKELNQNDFLFDFNPIIANRYLNRLGYKTLGFGHEYKVREASRITYKYKNGLTMYDFRHASACYWLPKYKSESALKYRFGWRRSKMIEYYTKFLGMKDTISEDDLIDSEAKTRLEKELEIERKKREMLEENFTELLKRQELFEKALKIKQLHSKLKMT